MSRPQADGPAPPPGGAPQPGSAAIVVVMGVSGSGKSTIAAALARRLGLPMIEGDDWHAPDHVRKMASGVPLSDADRQGWLIRLSALLGLHRSQGQGCVLACSALRRSYRDILRLGAPHALFVHLHGSEALLAERTGARSGHYMPASLLASQLATLEPPAADENALTLDLAEAPDSLVEAIERALR